ncbi:MAG: hypothetical protein L0Z73_10505 [Gammaproteobacteria bacterium]|nr:hypothetical protein [Gammaproteobacteria bacterium]
MKPSHLFILSSLLLSLSCNAKDDVKVDAKIAQDAITQYFTAKATVTKSRQPAFITGDFNGDGIKDMAVLFRPAQTVTTSKQVQTSSPWAFPGSVQSANYHTSLAIFNGGSGDWLSPDTQVFALLDKSGSLETPSFQLMLKKKTDNEYAQLQAMLPAKHQGDLIVLPTEAGIDTYVYWDKTTYKLYVPMETP